MSKDWKQIKQTCYVVEGGDLVPADASELYFPLESLREPWIGAAAALPGKALHVALIAAYSCALEKKATTVLKARLLTSWHVGRWAALEGLKQLEEAGLVAVERNPGSKTRVTPLNHRRKRGERGEEESNHADAI